VPIAWVYGSGPIILSTTGKNTNPLYKPKTMTSTKICEIDAVLISGTIYVSFCKAYTFTNACDEYEFTVAIVANINNVDVPPWNTAGPMSITDLRARSVLSLLAMVINV
jgi:hypothetical protein